MQDVRGLDAVQDQVHDRNDIGQRLLLLAVEGLFLKRLDVPGSEFATGLQIVEGLAEKAPRATGTVIDGLADLRSNHLDHGTDERARGVILAAVAAGIAHALDLLLVERGEFVLLHLRPETQLVDVVNDLAQVVAAGNLVFDLAENLADFVFNGARPGGPLREIVEIGKELLVDEILQVIARERGIVVKLAVRSLGRGPALPAVGLFEFVGVCLPAEGGLVGAVLLQAVEILQKQQPRGLFRVIQLGRASRLFPEDVVYILEGLLKHRFLFSIL